MGRMSILNGSIEFPVPWSTGNYYSQRRLSDFTGPEGIRQSLLLKPSTSDGKASVSTLPTSKQVTNSQANDPSEALSILNTIEKPNYNYIRDQERAKRKAEKLAKQEARRIPEVNHFFTTKQIKKLNKLLPKPSKQKHKLPSPSLPAPMPTPPSPQTPLPPVTPKSSFIRTKLEAIANSSAIEPTVKITLALLTTIPIIVLLLTGCLIAILLISPETVVGSVELVPKQINTSLQNNTIIQNETNYTGMPGFTFNPNYTSSSGRDVVVVHIPNTPKKPSPSVPFNPPTKVNTTNTSTTNTSPSTPPIISSDHDLSGIPPQLLWQIPYDCYWELRALGFGAELEVEYACNSQGTGLWITACECCKKMGRCS